MIDRILGSLRALVESFTERQPMSFVWRYSVVSATETSFSGRALSPLCPFADMPNIPLMPGIAGAGIKPAVGSIVGVAFLDGDPSKPFVVCWDQTVPVSATVDASSTIRVGPSTSTVDLANGSNGVVRVNDLGSGGTWATVLGTLNYFGADGTTVWQITATASGNPVIFTLVPVTGTVGAVVTKATAGSSIVKAGG